jgi:spermidine/putrescine transport system substrate-binding protein
MPSRPDPIRILAPEGFQRAISRRSLFQIGGAAAGLALVAACGDDDVASSNSTAGTSAGTSASGGTTPAAPSGGVAGFSEVVNKSSGTLAMFNWADYHDPDIIGPLADSTLGVQMRVDTYESNDDLITKLAAANGTSGYDICVPTGPYIPQMIQKQLIQKFDKSKLPNMVNVDPNYLGQAWDPTNDYSVCKDWGSTGWMWDSTKIKGDIKNWSDFIAACQGDGSGNCSVLGTAANVCGMYFFANGIDWNTDKKEDLDACEKFMVDEFAQHIKGFDSYPSTKLAEGAYTLAMIWNGDARQAYVRIKDSGGNPDDWKWALGTPDTELWMDNYAIVAGAPNPDAAYAWINWVLTPEISIKDLAYHGYNTGLKSMEDLIAQLAPDLAHPEMVFFDDAQVKSMHTEVINDSHQRRVDILTKVMAKAGG